MTSSVRSRQSSDLVHGLIVVDKPAGITSHDVVDVVRRSVGQRRVGHCGSLDPLATGVLVLCLGRATRLARFVAAVPKTYIGSMRLGVVTDTQDRCGRVLERRAVSADAGDRLDEVARRFVGALEQIPPMYSAVKQNGVPLYRLARAGRSVPRRPRRITVYELDCERVGRARVNFRTVCSSGTYVRTLCHDIGIELGCGAVMSTLRRVAVGCFTVDEAVSLDECRSRQAVLDRLRRPAEAVRELPFATVAPPDAACVVKGQPVTVGSIQGRSREECWIRVERQDGRLLAVGIARSNGSENGRVVVWPKVVLEDPVCAS